MRVREAVPRDGEAIAEVQVESWRAAYRGLLPDAYLESLSVERRTTAWNGILSRGESQTLVAVEDRGDVVGFASLGPSRDPDAAERTGELYALYVRSAHWSQGYGRELLGAVLDRSATLGFARLTLWVLKGNDRARRFYERAGMTADGAEKVEVRAPPDVELEEVRYLLVLKA